MDEEEEWGDLNSDEEDDGLIRYADDSMDDPLSDDDGDGGGDEAYYPFSRPLDTDDPLLNIE